MLDDGGGGQPVEVIAASDDVEAGQGQGPHYAGTPRGSAPGSPNVLTTAHVRTKVVPPPGAASLGLAGTYAIVRRFEFSAEKQRNAVVVRRPDGSLAVMAKGSPEMMRRLAGARLAGLGLGLRAGVRLGCKRQQGRPAAPPLLLRACAARRSCTRVHCWPPALTPPPSRLHPTCPTTSPLRSPRHRAARL